MAEPQQCREYDSELPAKQPEHSVIDTRWWTGWIPFALLPCGVVFLSPPTWPPWAFMWALAFAIFSGCKWLTWRRSLFPGVSRWRHAGYLAAWPGLDAVSFLNSHPTPAKPGLREWCFAWCKLALGALLLFGAARLMPAEHPYLVGWVGMVGIVMVLHFGTFHLLSCAWRRAGVDARPLMDWFMTP